MPICTKLGRTVTYNEELPYIKSRDKLNMLYLFITRKTLVPKLSKFVARCKKLPPITSHSPSNTWSHEITWNIKKATKSGRVITFCKGLLVIKLHDHLIMWSSWITWQIKKVLTPLQQCLKPPAIVVRWRRVRVLS